MKNILATLVLGLSLSSCVQETPVTSAAPPTTDAKPVIKQSEFFRPATLGDTGIKGVRYIGKTVSDIDETVAFYKQSVPFDVVSRYRVPANQLFPSELMADQHNEIEIALIQTATVFVQLIDFNPDRKEVPYKKPVYGPGYTHICFQSSASDPALSKFMKAGLEMVSRNAPVDLGGYGVTYAYGRDPDGTMIENETVDRPRRSDRAWITHIGGATSDVDRMVDFYTKVIGYGARRRGEYANFKRIDDVAGIDGLELRSSWFAVRNLEIEFWEFVKPATPVRDEPANVDQLGYNMTAFEVTDADAEAKRLKAKGIETIGPAKINQGWKIYFAYDPDGNIISIQQNISAPKSQSIDDMLWIDPTTF